MDDGSSEIEQARDAELNTDTRQLFAYLSMAINLKRIADANETDTRDYFAGLALQGLLAHHGDATWHPESDIQSISGAAETAYLYADSMMEARKQ